ncbi:hypothetical protein S21ZY_094 [Pseudomonas phage ZY21]|nr:hypothetical protein S21ZY_094 [Pseudomonas phage ZY21]
MKALDLKLKKAEQRAIRSGAKREAKKLAKQAGKFRADALAAGLQLHQMGARPYNKHHPVYEEMVMPLLEEAARIASNAGFDVLLQVRTPLHTEPNFTHCIGSFQDDKNLTPTMKAQVDLIRARPAFGGESFPEVNAPAEPTE